MFFVSRSAPAKGMAIVVPPVSNMPMIRVVLHDEICLWVQPEGNNSNGGEFACDDFLAFMRM